MVNKQDAFWEANNGHLPDSFYQKYLSDSSYSIFTSNNPFNINNGEDLDETDAVTSDSSESDLLWQFNNAKLASIVTNKPDLKLAKIPGVRYFISSFS